EFVFAQDPVVHENAGELIADGLVDQHGGDGRIDASGEAADDVAFANLFADAGDGGLDEVGGSPVALRATAVEDEVLDELRTKRSVVNLRVKLHGPDTAVFVRDGGECVGGYGCAPETGGEFEGLVPVAHPDLDGYGKTGEKLRGSVFEG